MTSPEVLHRAVLDRLAGLSVTVYDSQVDDRPPADGDGRVYPYAVLWPHPGWTPGTGRDLEHDAAGSLVWDARITVASGNPLWTLRAVPLIRARLDNWPILRGNRLAELEGVTDVIPDRDTSPPRWYVPLTFRAYL